jgi:hypothetical protein
MNPITLPRNATAEEVAAVVAALLGSSGERTQDGYRLWRATRLKALRDKAAQRRIW